MATVLIYCTNTVSKTNDMLNFHASCCILCMQHDMLWCCIPFFSFAHTRDLSGLFVFHKQKVLSTCLYVLVFPFFFETLTFFQRLLRYICLHLHRFKKLFYINTNIENTNFLNKDLISQILSLVFSPHTYVRVNVNIVKNRRAQDL